MSKLPVILLTFANDQSAYLEHLKAESSRIQQALESLEDHEAIHLMREESADSDKTLRLFNRFDGRIIAFHYGGHASSAGLKLEDTKAQAEGLAQLLARQDSLCFVFLNGCSTQGQVSRLLQLGVPLIIATHSPVDDLKATEFAGFFYDKLANNGSVQQAFNYACDSLQLKYLEFRRPGIYQVDAKRTLAIEDENDELGLPWGLYYNEDQPEVLDWCIPLPPARNLDRPQPEADYEVNEYLYAILEEMARFDQDIEEALERMEDDREYFELIIKNYPWNIGSQFGLLVGEKEVGRSRLEQIISTYIAYGQWLYFVPLSQLWKAATEEQIKAFPSPPDQVFTINKENFPTYDYILAFQRTLEQLRENDIELFVQELEGLKQRFEKAGALYDAYLLLESIRERLVQDKLEADVPALIQLCADAEHALGELLSHLAFIVKYQMITVRDIIVFNPRHLNTKYLHKMGRLNAHTDERLFFFRDPKQYDSPLENDAVLLLNDPENVQNFLSLSPFFIDRNAFRDKNADLTDLYTYAYAKLAPKSEQSSFYYLKSSRNMLVAFDNDLDKLCTDEEVVSDVRRRGARGLKNRPQRANPNNRPYALLHDQFNHLLELLQ